MGIKTVNLGDEFDKHLELRLNNVLKQLGGVTVSLKRGIAGSQDLTEWKLDVNGQPITVECETYIGLSITGESKLVDDIVAAVQ
jgi:hypothetical protein